MTVRIREADYETATGVTYPVRADETRGHLMIIASGGTMSLEPSFGDAPDPADPAYSIVQYDPGPQDTATSSGQVRERLKALVDEAADNQIIGVGGETIWSDGTTVQATPAFALGDTLFYDTSNANGAGRWIIGINGNQECTNPAVILFHELAHGFRNHGAGDLATEEKEAIEDENMLRMALGLVPRDPDRIDGGPGCPDDGCCIVASVASGSPYAANVNRLRRLRDDTLRRSTLGALFFEELFREYYAFSVEIARILVRDDAARGLVEQWLVRPLVGMLEVMKLYSFAPLDEQRLGEELLALLGEDREAFAGAAGSQGAVRAAAGMLDALAAGDVPPQLAVQMDEGTRRVCSILASWLPRSPQVVWGILEPLRLYREALLSFSARTEAATAGRWLATRIEQWLRAMPLQRLDSRVDGGLSHQLITGFVDTLVEDDARRQALAAVLLERCRVEGLAIPPILPRSLS